MAKPPSKITLINRELTRRRNAAKRRRSLQQDPLGRLTLEGAGSVQRMRQRLHWLAREWQIPQERLPDLKRGGLVSEKIVDFTKKYGISLDWLFIGDMKGLQRMMRGPR